MSEQNEDDGTRAQQARTTTHNERRGQYGHYRAAREAAQKGGNGAHPCPNCWQPMPTLNCVFCKECWDILPESIRAVVRQQAHAVSQTGPKQLLLSVYSLSLDLAAAWLCLHTPPKG